MTSLLFSYFAACNFDYFFQARDENHAEERARLEMEITQLKMHLNKDYGIGGIKKGSTRSGADNSDENVAKLKKVGEVLLYITSN